MGTTTLSELTVEQLKRAVAIREQIDELERELNQLVSGTGKASSGRGRRRGQLSSAARERIAEAQRLRWAKHRETKETPGKEPAEKVSRGRRRRLSPAARARIAAAQRERWAKVKRSA